MKATLTLTSRGVVTLPAKLRRALGLKADDQLIAETTPEGLLLRPAVTLPVEIYSEKRILEFDEPKPTSPKRSVVGAARRNAAVRCDGCGSFSTRMFCSPRRSQTER